MHDHTVFTPIVLAKDFLLTSLAQHDASNVLHLSVRSVTSPDPHWVSAYLRSNGLAKACWPACHSQPPTSLGEDCGHACTDVDEMQACKLWLRHHPPHRESGQV